MQTTPSKQQQRKISRSKAMHMETNAQAAQQARAEREERRQFKLEQKEVMRQRAAVLLAQQRTRPAMEEGHRARRHGQATSGGVYPSTSAAPAPRVVSLGALSSVDRAEVQRVLQRDLAHGALWC